MGWKKGIVGILALFLLAGCARGDGAPQTGQPPATESAASPPTPTGRAFRRSATAVTTVQPQSVTQTPIAGTVEPAPQAQVDAAIADLIGRRGVARDAIRVVEARSVTWPNGGLGCPEPGVNYMQVPVDGVFIRLEIGTEPFHYHGAIGETPFICTNQK